MLFLRDLYKSSALSCPAPPPSSRASYRSSRSSSRESPEKQLSDGDISIVDLKLDPIDLEPAIGELDVHEGPSLHNSMSMGAVSEILLLSCAVICSRDVLYVSTGSPTSRSMERPMLTTFMTIRI